MRKQLGNVAEFYKAMDDGSLIGSRPRTGSAVGQERIDNRHALLVEEVSEYLEAASGGNMEGTADALVDIAYILFGAVIEHGLQDRFNSLFAEVHRANMAKRVLPDNREATIMLHENKGEECVMLEVGDHFVVKRVRDRKIMKPSGWVPAQLRPILEMEAVAGITADDLMEEETRKDDPFWKLIEDQRFPNFQGGRITLAHEVEGAGVILRNEFGIKGLVLTATGPTEALTLKVDTVFIPNLQIVENKDLRVDGERTTYSLQKAE